MSRLLQQQGWTVDATHDLSRLMRIPGTINNKEPALPVRVAVLVQDGPRYSQEELILQVPEGYHPMGPKPKSEAAKKARPGARLGPAGKKASRKNRDRSGNGSLILHPDAEPPALKLAALLMNDLKFRKSWKGTRWDLADQSPSAYDMSLAAMAVNAGWSDQETANLMIARRAKHGHDLKLRESYYQRTSPRPGNRWSRPLPRDVTRTIAKSPPLPVILSGAKNLSYSGETLRCAQSDAVSQ